MHATQLDAGEKLETLDSTTLRLTDYPQVHDRAQLGPLGSLRLTQQAPYRVARGSQAWIRCPSCAPSCRLEAVQPLGEPVRMAQSAPNYCPCHWMLAGDACSSGTSH